MAGAILFQGFSLGPTVLGGTNIATANAPREDLNDVATAYFFVRQIGYTVGVTGATIFFDHRLTLHSSRLLDVANRLDPIATSTLADYAALIQRNGGGSSDPAIGALQLFQSVVVIQTRLLSFIDIYTALAVVAFVGLVVVIITGIKGTSEEHLFHIF